MKASKYNCYLSSVDRGIIYNNSTDYISELVKHLYELFRQNQDHPEAISKLAPELFQHLVNHHFIVESDVDEEQQILDKWIAEDQNGDNLQLTINPTMQCNLQCYYCYEEHSKGTYMKPATIEATLAHIRRQIDSGKFRRISISFFGGEPLLYFKQVVKPLLEKVKEMKSDHVEINIHFTSNITLLTNEILQYLLPWKPSFQITIDGNEFIHNMVKQLPGKKSAYRIAIKNIRTLLAHNLAVAIRFNYTAKTLDYFYDVINDLKPLSDQEKMFANINFHRIWQDTRIPDSELQPKVLQIENAFREAGLFVISSTSRTIGRCYADVENSLVINYDGRIYKCTARPFDEEHSEGVLQPDGSILWNERHQKRLAVRYCNTVCHRCIIFPLCHGGCSQNRLESLTPNGCIKGFSEKDKQDYILQRIKGLYAEGKRKEVITKK